jgi:hypothetical protein
MAPAQLVCLGALAIERSDDLFGGVCRLAILSHGETYN